MKQQLHSYEEWKSLGYHVVKGERSGSRDRNGVPQFSSDQVSKTCKRDALEDRPIRPKRELAGHMGKPIVGRMPYYREHEVPPEAYSDDCLPQEDHMDALMSMMNPTHVVMRSLKNHLDSVFEKHHWGSFDCEDDMW